MSLPPAARIGPYEIIAPLGAGGMGEVYRARDERLDRDVAIKALPAEFAQDPERLARFEREAKLLASLNHPNVGTIYGFEEADGSRYLVLELVEGETLGARLQRGALPRAEALDVCRQIAAALEAAHEAGIIHRDLKPGNVMLTPAGAVKVLDFGLAKTAAEATSDPNLSASPTLTHAAPAATAAGVILGTAAYMSPEQARGKAVDKRTDIWSFGCVLYECLAGHQCFAGETVSDLIAQILQTEPDWDELPAKTSKRVRQVLRRCLDKDPRRRLRDIGDARIELEDVVAQSASSSTIVAGRSGPAPPSGLRMIALGALLVVATAVTTIAVWRSLDRTPPVSPIRFEIADAEDMIVSTDGGEMSISPDGKMLAFVAGDSTIGRLWVRSLETLEARPIEGSETAYQPFWSPDSRHIGFFTNGRLNRVPAEGGGVEQLSDVKIARGGTWNRQDVIVFAPSPNGPLFRIAATGGEPEQITRIDSTSGETAHRFPRFLPDGRHFTYSSLPPKEGLFDTFVGELDSPKRELLTSVRSGVHYVEPGYLLHTRNGLIVAQPFDAASRKLRGSPVTLRETVSLSQYSGAPSFSVSSNGVLVYGTPNIPDTRLAWVDREGREIGSVPIEPAPYFNFQISPDDRRVALVRQGLGINSDILIGDLERGVATRLSQEEASCTSPWWSPDGTRLAYEVTDMGPQSIVIRAVSGSSETETLLQSDPVFKTLDGWTPDGRSLVYGRQHPQNAFDMWILPLDGAGEPWPYLTTPFFEAAGSVSRDARWMVYSSNESGRFEVYVQPFPKTGFKYQVTKGGAFFANWSHDGTRLFFIDSTSPNTVKVADVIPGAEFRLGPARPYIILRPDQLVTRATRDGRLLALLPAGRAVANSITVVLNWAEGVESR